jgi:hypothetical protein
MSGNIYPVEIPDIERQEGRGQQNKGKIVDRGFFGFRHNI